MSTARPATICATPAVNARIREAFMNAGADAWFGADHQALLGPDHKLEDYEVVNDILDVWFDSGSTHSFVVEPQFGTNADDPRGPLPRRVGSASRLVPVLAAGKLRHEGPRAL
jgi:isoleucyl-tRNA synthetase